MHPSTADYQMLIDLGLESKTIPLKQKMKFVWESFFSNSSSAQIQRKLITFPQKFELEVAEISGNL